MHTSHAPIFHWKHPMTDLPDIARRIDHTLLNAEATLDHIDHAVDQALEHNFAAVCVNPIYISHVGARLRGTSVAACTVAGFPLGANLAATKAAEAVAAARSGAQEIDVVVHLPRLLEEDLLGIRGELMELVYAVREVRPNIIVKAIVETAVLMADVSSDQAESRIRTACQGVREAGCDFIKTSTGLHKFGGATVEAVTLLRRHAQGLKVKAAGGVRSLEDARKMIAAGADRLGSSSSVKLIQGQTSTGY